MTAEVGAGSQPGDPAAGPLSGVRVVELAGLGPAPFGAMVLADLGADVLRVERTRMPGPRPGAVDRRLVLTRGRPAVGVDLKAPRGAAVVLRMVEQADVLLEGFRPGVLERLGLGPEVCLARNPQLVYGRITGYGQDGPLAGAPGHDINYIALAGALSPIGRRGQGPVPPLNLLGDFGGGGMLLVVGILAALHERTRSGLGQVVDAAMVDGTALLTTQLQEMRGLSRWNDQRGTNFMDTGSHYYNVYETSDGRHLAVGAMEPAFYRSFMAGLGFTGADLPPQDDPTRWEALTRQVADIIGRRSQAEWLEVFDGTDACVTPVLSPGEAPAHPHNRARGTFVELGGTVEPAPAPRFSRTPAPPPAPVPEPGAHPTGQLVRWGIDPTELDSLLEDGVVD